MQIFRPKRAKIGTENAFSVRYSVDISDAIHFPFNLPMLSNSTDSSYIETKAFLGWLPNDSNTELATCMRHSSDYKEFMIPAEYWVPGVTSVHMSHMPFFSNCRGFGAAIPLWYVFEDPANCSLVPEEDTEPVLSFSFGGNSVGDSCSPSMQCVYLMRFLITS